MSEDSESGYCTLVEDWMAGVAHYRAGQVIDELSVDEDLTLRREAENQHDALAVAIRAPTTALHRCRRQAPARHTV
jgi:hypothetical protein